MNDIFYEAFKNKPEYPLKEQIVLKPVRKGLEDAGLDTALQVWGFSGDGTSGKLTNPFYNDLLAGSVASFIREETLIEGTFIQGDQEGNAEEVFPFYVFQTRHVRTLPIPSANMA